MDANDRDAEERAQFMLRMRARGVGDLRLLRALERAPRALFMPQRYADIAGRDVALPIGCGQTAPPPSMVAAMIGALDVAPEARALEVGTGSGYCAALLAQMAREVVSLERCQSLSVEAAARLSAFGLTEVRVLYADALAFDSSGRAFDRILVHALIEPPAPQLLRLLAPGGKLVAVVAGASAAEQRIVRLTRDSTGRIDASAHGAVRTYAPLAPGLAPAI